jgi:hypothetical protein
MLTTDLGFLLELYLGLVFEIGFEGYLFFCGVERNSWGFESKAGQNSY